MFKIKLILNTAIKIIALLSYMIFNFGCIEKKETLSNLASFDNGNHKWLTQEAKKEREKVIFHENFEASSIDEIITHWNDTKNTKEMSLNNDVPTGSKGKQSLMMTYKPKINTGGHLFKSFPKGYNSLYARFYVKFLTRKNNVHHLVKLGGYNPLSNYPQGNAGIRPNGDDRFITGIEPRSDYTWGFYTYWMHMFGNGNKYWGNTFSPDPLKKIPVNEWICVEFMIKLNNPVDQYNGEQAFWINGKKILHLGKGFPLLKGTGNRVESPEGSPFQGFQWRKDSNLKLNYFWLSYYMTKGVKGEIEQILFDEIVISTEYIGML